MKLTKKKKILSVEELTNNAEKILKGKEINPNGKQLFEKTIQKAVKQHSLK